MLMLGTTGGPRTDRRRVILYVNEKHSAFCGRTPEEELGSEIMSLIQFFPISSLLAILSLTGVLSLKARSSWGSVIPLTRGRPETKGKTRNSVFIDAHAKAMKNE